MIKNAGKQQKWMRVTIMICASGKKLLAARKGFLESRVNMFADLTVPTTDAWAADTVQKLCRRSLSSMQFWQVVQVFRDLRFLSTFFVTKLKAALHERETKGFLFCTNSTWSCGWSILSQWQHCWVVSCHVGRRAAACSSFVHWVRQRWYDLHASVLSNYLIDINIIMRYCFELK